jgi:hypothetical protein
VLKSLRWLLATRVAQKRVPRARTGFFKAFPAVRLLVSHIQENRHV